VVVEESDSEVETSDCVDSESEEERQPVFPTVGQEVAVYYSDNCECEKEDGRTCHCRDVWFWGKVKKVISKEKYLVHFDNGDKEEVDYLPGDGQWKFFNRV